MGPAAQPGPRAARRTDAFLSFLTAELHPRIERDYGTATSGHGLFGYSYGGLFSLYAWLSGITLFGSIGAGSPGVIGEVRRSPLSSRGRGYRVIVLDRPAGPGQGIECDRPVQLLHHRRGGDGVGGAFRLARPGKSPSGAPRTGPETDLGAFSRKRNRNTANSGTVLG
ncbi:alpha/beta hydrolase-fold protein [Amycolatopsis keratiniphila]